MITNIVQVLHTTAAYQQAVFQLMCGEANFVASKLEINEPKPLPIRQGANERNILPPPFGVGGSVMTSNYVFEFQKGRLAWISENDWFKRISPPITNLAELVDRPSLVDSNGAYQLATQWLSRLSIDVPALERKFPPHIFQVSGRQTSSSETNRVAVPVFQISWGAEKPPRDSFNPIRVKLLGTTRELLDLSIRDASFFQASPLIVTNSAQLLGPIPPPRYFIEQLVGGTEAYETVNHPDRTEIWLLSSNQEDGHFSPNKPRTVPVQLKGKAARKFSVPLLDFNSYAWTVQKNCIPDYGAKVRFTRGKDSVEFVLCYECDILQVSHNGEAHLENFDYGHNNLVKALQSVFSRDEVVDGLKFNDDKPEDLLKMFQAQ